MDNFRYVNAGNSTLADGIVAADTQITVANQARFPSSLESGEKLVLTIHPSGLPSTQEIVICTAISGGVMTVTRGAQGTTAQDWPTGTVVGAYLTAEMLGQIRDKALTVSGTNTGDETAARIGTLIAGATAKSTPVDADMIGLADSAASNVLKKFSWSALKAALKTYFDTVYNKYVHPNHSGDVTSVADGAQTIEANAVTNTKLADMANSTIKGRITAGSGDPEDLTATHVRTILNVANGAQKNSDITKGEIEAKLTGELSSHSHAAATLPTASATVSGVVELATTEEAAAGTDTARAVTPAGVAAAIASLAPLTLTTGSLVYAEDSLETVKSGLTANSFGSGLAARSSESAIAAWLTAHQGNAKAVKMYHGGEVTVSFSAKGSAGTSYVRLAKNASLEQEWSMNTSYQTRTRNVTVTAGDILLIQVRDDDNIIGYVKDFKVLVAGLP